MKDVGTLKELGVQAGDVVEYTSIGEPHFKAKTFTFAGWKGQIPYSEDQEFGGETSLRTDSKAIFRIISRATTQPKLWRDMTAEEKGALLLAAHEGNVIEYWRRGTGGWSNKPRVWSDHESYRIKPNPKVETVTMLGGTECGVYGYGFYVVDEAVMQTHKITFTTIDGKPDCASVKMEEL